MTAARPARAGTRNRLTVRRASSLCSRQSRGLSAPPSAASRTRAASRCLTALGLRAISEVPLRNPGMEEESREDCKAARHNVGLERQTDPDEAVMKWQNVGPDRDWQSAVHPRQIRDAGKGRGNGGGERRKWIPLGTPGLQVRFPFVSPRAAGSVPGQRAQAEGGPDKKQAERTAEITSHAPRRLRNPSGAISRLQACTNPATVPEAASRAGGRKKTSSAACAGTDRSTRLGSRASAELERNQSNTADRPCLLSAQPVRTPGQRASLGRFQEPAGRGR